MNIAKRVVQSVTWNAIANGIKIPIGFIQSIILARLLPIEYFGIFGGSVALVTLFNQLLNIGLDAAFIHRSEETQDPSKALSVLFSLRFLISSIRGVILLLISIFFFSGLKQLVLIILTISGFISDIFAAPRILLTRNLEFKRLAFLKSSSIVITAIFSILIAWYHRSIWALLVSSIITPLWMIIVLYFWNPVWSPNFCWDKSTIRYYIKFGSKIQITRFLNSALENIDDLWSSFFLGDLALGLYSRAYKFATYPRTLIAMPILTVTTSTYAEVDCDRKKLSQAFFRVNALLIRTGFFFTGWLVAIAYQFIIIFLGEQWLPMLGSFRLLIFFALFDPIRDSISNLLVALGKTKPIIKVRSLQLVILITGLFVLGYHFGILGVSIAVDIMMLIGITLLYSQVRPYVDFSLTRLFLAPIASLVISYSTTFVLLKLIPSNQPWILFILGSLIFAVLYIGSLLLIEGKILFKATMEIISLTPWGRYLKINHITSKNSR